MTLVELREDSDWCHVFADEGSCTANVNKDVEVVGVCNREPLPTREMVEEILAYRNGENDGASWIGVFKLYDGRYLYATGGCDYTGWD
jgi:hypothetical protein